ncbi:MAG TPA: aldo/keto reductase [Vicinamibacterales bacterium]|nr:aldo/keto reductase [Vicinamibacterales bacterium]
MEYRRLGSTGLRISRIALGCGNFGGIGSAPAFFGMGENESQAFELMDRAWDAGVILFDTADAYGGGRSESFIGRWLKGKGVHVRERLLLSSKVFNPIGRGANDRGLSRLHVLRQVEASLKRLGTDRLDLYLIHEPDPDTPLEETLCALDDLVRAGKILYVGASNIETWRLARGCSISEARDWIRFEWVQNSYSLLDRSAESELFPFCLDRRIGFTAFSPLAGGWLTGKYRRGAAYPDRSRMTLRPEPYEHFVQDRVFAGLTRLEADAKSRGIEMAALAVSWVLHHPMMDAAIVGPRTPAHLETALRGLETRLSPDERTRIGMFFADEGGCL